jgi:hypothetical protein
MKREIATHGGTALNEQLRITVHDEPGHGNACHKYKVWPKELDTFDVCSDPKRGSRLVRACLDIQFQDGPIIECGVNGISNEALLAIVADRLQGFQSGKYACEENANALQAVESALDWMKRRTAKRIERGVEGTHQV